MNKNYCPACGHLVDRVLRPDPDAAPATNEYGDPLVFVEHDTIGDRAGRPVRERCSGSGRNIATARDAY